MPSAPSTPNAIRSHPRPWLAGLLGLIPGLGFLYLGYRRLAVVNARDSLFPIISIVYLHLYQPTAAPWTTIAGVFLGLAYAFLLWRIAKSSFLAYKLAQMLAVRQSATRHAQQAWRQASTESQTPTAGDEESPTIFTNEQKWLLTDSDGHIIATGTQDSPLTPNDLETDPTRDPDPDFDDHTHTIPDPTSGPTAATTSAPAKCPNCHHSLDADLDLDFCPWCAARLSD